MNQILTRLGHGECSVGNQEHFCSIVESTFYNLRHNTAIAFGNLAAIFFADFKLGKFYRRLKALRYVLFKVYGIAKQTCDFFYFDVLRYATVNSTTGFNK